MNSKHDSRSTDTPAPEHRAKMAVPPEAPPGIELDNKGNPIPLDQRTKNDREKAAGKTHSAD
jgi:hypothetical protein